MDYKHIDDGNLSLAFIITVLVSTVQYTSVSHCSLNFECQRLGYNFLLIILVLEKMQFGSLEVLEKCLNFILWVLLRTLISWVSQKRTSGNNWTQFCGPINSVKALKGTHGASQWDHLLDLNFSWSTNWLPRHRTPNLLCQQSPVYRVWMEVWCASLLNSVSNSVVVVL